MIITVLSVTAILNIISENTTCLVSQQLLFCTENHNCASIIYILSHLAILCIVCTVIFITIYIL